MNRNSFQACAHAEITILELTVHNSPGVMASVCGRFASRAFNVEGIICLPLAHDPTLSRIWLMVHEEAEMEQLIHQLVKMVDVISIQRREAAEDTFRDVESLFA